MVKIFICFNLYASMEFVSFDMEMWNFSNIICFDKDFEFIREVPNSCNLRRFCPFHVFINVLFMFLLKWRFSAGVQLRLPKRPEPKRPAVRGSAGGAGAGRSVRNSG